MKTYGIKPGYRCNLRAGVCRDRPEHALIYQVPVYRRAAELITGRALATVLDIGCGLGAKLEQLIQPTGAAITGVDLPDHVAWCRARYTFGRWIDDDIERPRADLGSTFDLIVSADVIEHLKDPDALIRYARRWSHAGTYVLLSTPERDLRRGPGDMGPPANPAHVREWNAGELRGYLASEGLRIVEHRIVDLRPGMRTCQLALGTWLNSADPRP